MFNYCLMFNIDCDIKLCKCVLHLPFSSIKHTIDNAPKIYIRIRLIIRYSVVAEACQIIYDINLYLNSSPILKV